jgi:RNA polymerase sigma-70 factor (ECF subfamily)
MAERPDIFGSETEQIRAEERVPTSEVEAWFVRKVLPLEASLMRYLQSSCRNSAEAADLRQDVYANVIAAAHREIPTHARAFVLATAKHLLMNRLRHERIVSIDTVSDLDELGLAAEEPEQDRVLIAREELRRVREAIEKLPPRAREAVVLRRIEGLSGREIAQRMGISESTVSHYVDNAMRALSDLLYGGSDRGK